MAEMTLPVPFGVDLDGALRPGAFTSIRGIAARWK
jgi:hypothetical protein